MSAATKDICFCQKNLLETAAHLKLLSKLQIDIVHLGNRNIVVFSFLLVQQLVPKRVKKQKGNFFWFTFA